MAGTGSLEEYDAVLLAGGGAKRLGGVDKPGLELGGRTLVERVAEAAAGARRLILVGPSRPRLSRAIVTRERPPGAGPVPALRAGLAHVQAAWVAVLAADLPFLVAAHIDALRTAAREHAGAVLLDGSGREQWLTGVWRTAALRAALDAYDGVSLRGLLGPLRPERLALRVSEGAPPPWLDCDTIGDVTSAKGWM
ncbi:MAG: NTP transferase domain-containing protein [Streptosporangiales bacterium]|nr:NTP transferase domain-containing protein [Streptosporangiales bacterium]